MPFELLSNLTVTAVRTVATLFSPAGAGNVRKDRPCWAIVLKHEGETVYTVNGLTYRSDRLHPILLPRGCSYEWRCTKDGHYTVLEFDSPQTAAHPISFSIKSSERIQKELQELEHRRNFGHPLSAMESIRNAYSVLLELLQTATAPYLPKKKQKIVSVAIDYLSQHATEAVKNDQLAALCGVSTAYFRRLFTQATGCSPMVYARQLRIQRAKELLQSDYGSLSDLALSLGYPNLYDFSRDFKKHVGVSPTQYTKRQGTPT